MMSAIGSLLSGTINESGSTPPQEYCGNAGTEIIRPFLKPVVKYVCDKKRVLVMWCDSTRYSLPNTIYTCKAVTNCVKL